MAPAACPEETVYEEALERVADAFALWVEDATPPRALALQRAVANLRAASRVLLREQEERRPG